MKKRDFYSHNTMQSTNLVDNDMNYKHFPLKCDLRDLRPTDRVAHFQFPFSQENYN